MTEFELATLGFQKWALIAQWVIGIGQLALIGGGLVMMQLAGRRRDRMLDQMMEALARERDESQKRHEEAMRRHDEAVRRHDEAMRKLDEEREESLRRHEEAMAESERRHAETMAASEKRHEEAMAAQAESRAALEAVIKGLETVIERTGRGKE